jgi:amino acid adenylation domain-containing protein
MEYLPDRSSWDERTDIEITPVDVSTTPPFSCYLIGRESFLIPCGEVLLAHNCHILGIVSTGEAIAHWAQAQEIPLISPTVNLKDCLSQQPFDYLFSISNSVILSQEIIDLPRRGAINCHDALLPKYGGLSAPAWAIFHGEPIHGVTWHRVTTTVDGGDILQQGTVRVDDRETALSLSIKCYEEILRRFRQLVEELVTGTVCATRQNLAERSYFGRAHKPTPGCILSWDLKAENIDRTIRALTFGDYENYIGMPKFMIGNQPIVVTEVAILDRLSQAAPGTIVEIESDRLTVATSSYDLLLLAVQTVDGQARSIAELVNQFQLQINDRFTDLAPDLTQQIAQVEQGLVKHENFWVDRLARLNPLPIPFSTLSNNSSSGWQSHDWVCPPAVSEFCAAVPSPLPGSHFLFAAIVALLGRISQQTSFDLGLRLATLDGQLTGLPELFADAVPLRIDLQDDRSFAQSVDILSHQIAQIERRQTYARDIVLRYPELKALAKLSVKDRLAVGIAIVAEIEDYRCEPPHGLTFVLTEQGDRLRCYYDRALLDRHSIEGMLHQLTVLIEGMISDPDQSISSLPLLSDRDLERLLVEWNDTYQAYPTDQCIHELFEAQVERHPDAIAVVWAGQQLTYRELNDRANRLAHYLSGLGVQPDVMVGISVERSIEMVVGILGILKAGGAYVPLDPEYPPERLEFMVADTEIAVLLTQSTLIDKLPAHRARIVCIDRDLPGGEEWATDNFRSGVEPHHLVYAMYTSGSTGTPKGVLIEHRSLVNYALAAVGEYQVTPHDRILQFASLNFDISVEEIFTSLVSGATLVLRTEETLDLGTFLQHGRDWGITVVSLPTAYWHELTMRLETDREGLPPSLRLVIIGGEKIATARFRAWQQAVGSRVRLINTYGPTEATVIALWSDLSELDANTDRLEIPIGRPLPNFQVYILDADLQPVPIGVPGELHIGGAGLARHYHNRPERNASRFVANPFSPRSGDRLYKTGDLVRYRADGNIDFLGRIDRQVKIRGFRVELGEIETVLDRHPAIAQTVVAVREDRPGQKQLVAYCVPKNGSQPQTSDLRSFTAQQLPNYMVPALFVMLSELPLSPNGKVDLRALPAPEDTRPDPTATFIAPQDEIERQLTEIWQQVLGVNPIGIKDNFFDLGGHSLLAVRLFNDIEQVWGKKLPLASLFQAPTIAQLAALLRQDRQHTSWSSLVLIRSGTTQQPPVFCIHPVGGNILEYQALANYLDERHTIYGLQSRGLDGQQPPLQRITDMAREYIQEMQTVQPEGQPYFLLGYSLGGTIAFEIARQLYAQGQPVDLLGLLDCQAPNLPMQRPPLAQSLGIHALNWWRLRSGEKLKYITDRLKYQFKQVDERQILIEGLSQSVQLSSELVYVIDSNFQAAADYIPQPYPGHATLFRSQVQRVEQALHHDLGWSKLVTGEIEVYPVSTSSHDAFLKEPGVKLVAEKLKQCLAKKILQQSGVAQNPIDSTRQIEFFHRPVAANRISQN